MRVNRRDVDAMVKLAQQNAAADGVTRYLYATYYGMAIVKSRWMSQTNIEVLPNGSVTTLDAWDGKYNAQ